MKKILALTAALVVASPALPMPNPDLPKQCTDWKAVAAFDEILLAAKNREIEGDKNDGKLEMNRIEFVMQIEGDRAAALAGACNR